MSNHFYDLPNTMVRRNKHTHPSPSNVLRFINAPALFSRAGLLAAESFVYPPIKTESPIADIKGDIAFTMYVVADLDSDVGRALIKETLNSLVNIFSAFYQLHGLSIC